MQQIKRYEILNGLPAYGPMYVPVSDDGEQFHYEGLGIRFYKTDGSEWVANFKPGWSNCILVVDYPHTNRIIVIAKGQGYIMSPDSEKPIDTFGINITTALQTNDNKIILSDGIYVWLMTETGIVWQSERISWDGIKNLNLENNILTGFAYDPTDSITDWKPFTINIDTKEITGGSYRIY